MAAQVRPVLGIEIRPEAIRVVEMQGAWPDAQILRVDSAKLPHSALEAGRIVEVESVSQILRELLERMGTATRDAILGIAEQNVITRVIEVPQVPDSEMRMVVEGELAHYQILSAQTTALDYMRLPESSEPDVQPQVLVVAAEESVIKSYCQMAELAGLRLLALEPILFSMYRAAFLQIDRHSETLSIAIGSTDTEIAIIEQGQIRLYRRVDIGSSHLLPEFTLPGFAPHHEASLVFRAPYSDDEEAAPSAEELRAAAERLDPESSRNLEMELRRSLEYYYSLNAQASAIGHGVISLQTSSLESLAAQLSQALQIQMIVTRLPLQWAAKPEVASALASPHDLEFLPACGLAMRGLSNTPSSLPSFDLSTRQRRDTGFQGSRRQLTVSLVASVGMLLAGLCIAFSVSARANNVSDNLLHVKNNLTTLQQRKQARMDTIQTQVNLVRALRAEGYPVPRILDSIGGALAPHASLVEVTLTPDGRLTLTGEASNEQAIIGTLEGLKNNPYLEDTMLDSFGKSASGAGTYSLERFQVTAQLVGSKHPDPVKVP